MSLSPLNDETHFTVNGDLATGYSRRLRSSERGNKSKLKMRMLHSTANSAGRWKIKKR